MKPNQRIPRGFTLIELAMVLLIIGLLVGGLLPSLSVQMEAQRSAETRKQLDEIQQALIGFAVANGRLPCPASSSSKGAESPTGGGACTNFNDGFVPAVTLGIANVDSTGQLLDPWGNPIHYAVTAWSSTSPAVSNVYTASNGMAAVGISGLSPNLQVCSTASGISASACASGASLTSNGGVPAIVYSLGKNGATGGSGLDEAANLDGNRTFVSHTPSSASAANGEFDDLMIWISPNILLNRMVAAGKLP